MLFYISLWVILKLKTIYLSIDIVLKKLSIQNIQTNYVSYIHTKLHRASCNITLNRTIKKFENVPLCEFWIALQSEYEEMSQSEIQIWLHFTSTYLCETSFSAMVLIKTKQRIRLKAERVAVSNIEPLIDTMAKKNKVHDIDQIYLTRGART